MLLTQTSNIWVEGRCAAQQKSSGVIPKERAGGICMSHFPCQTSSAAKLTSVAQAGPIPLPPSQMSRKKKKRELIKETRLICLCNTFVLVLKSESKPVRFAWLFIFSKHRCTHAMIQSSDGCVSLCAILCDLSCSDMGPQHDKDHRAKSGPERSRGTSHLSRLSSQDVLWPDVLSWDAFQLYEKTTSSIMKRVRKHWIMCQDFSSLIITKQKLPLRHTCIKILCQWLGRLTLTLTDWSAVSPDHSLDSAVAELAVCSFPPRSSAHNLTGQYNTLNRCTDEAISQSQPSESVGGGMGQSWMPSSSRRNVAAHCKDQC